MITSKVLDRGAIELLGPFGLTNSLYGGSRNIALLDTSVVTDYAMYIMIGLLSLVLIIFSNVFSLDFRFVIVIIATLLCTFKSPFYFSC
jgi:NADH-ubiquinone oxidoreductase chain 5